MTDHTLPTPEAETISLCLNDLDFAQATGAVDPRLSGHLIAQTANALAPITGSTAEERREGVAATVHALKALGPRDVVEGLLAAQMVAVHAAAFECLRRANLEHQSPEGRERNLRHVAKLAGLYVRQVDTLDRRRGRGANRVRVEHVTVESGGQAVVGTVNAAISLPANPWL